MLKQKHVIFRSKGCRTCRTRKVKCDETRPFCQRCTRSNFQCQGYSEPTTFLSENPQDQESPSPGSSQFAQDLDTTSLSGTSQRASPPEEPTRINFLVERLAIGIPSDGRGYSWLRWGLDSSDENSLVYKSSRCLADVIYGLYFRLQDVTTDGMAKYGDLLQLLRQEVQAPEPLNLVDLIQAIVTAHMLESIVSSPSEEGTGTHIYGLRQVIERAGPETFQIGPNSIMFNLCRCHLVGSAILHKYYTFLAEPEWKLIPWQYETKSTIQELWDILCDVPSFVINLQSLQDSHVGLEFQIPIQSDSPIAFEFKALLQGAFDWRWRWESEQGGSAEEIPAVPENNLVTDFNGYPLFSTLIHHDSFSCAQDMVLYSGFLLFLLRVGMQMLGEDALSGINAAPPPGMVHPIRPSPALLPHEIHSFDDALSDFYRLMEGYLSVEGKTSGDYRQLMFPFSLVAVGLDVNSMEGIWMRKMRSRIAERSGYDIWNSARMIMEG